MCIYLLGGFRKRKLTLSVLRLKFYLCLGFIEICKYIPLQCFGINYSHILGIEKKYTEYLARLKIFTESCALGYTF